MCIHTSNVSSSVTHSRVYTHTSMDTYWSLWKWVGERSTWRGHRHWHCSIRSTNRCCKATSSSSSRAPFLHIICESNINKICLYPRRSFCLRRREKPVSLTHIAGHVPPKQILRRRPVWRKFTGIVPWDKDLWGIEGSRAGLPSSHNCSVNSLRSSAAGMGLQQVP